MSQLNLGSLRGRRWPVVATGFAAAVLVLGVIDSVGHLLSTALLGLLTSGGPMGALQLWRPLTFGFTSGGLLGAVLSAIFGYWILSGAERMWENRTIVLVALGGLLAVAAIAPWTTWGVLTGASFVAWAVICGQTYHAWRRGGNVRDQLMLLLLCLLLNLQGGTRGLLLSLAAAAGGVLITYLLHDVKLPTRTPADPYEAFVRQRQGKGPKAAPTRQWYAIGACVLMLVLWAMGVLAH